MVTAVQRRFLAQSVGDLPHAVAAPRAIELYADIAGFRHEAGFVALMPLQFADICSDNALTRRRRLHIGAYATGVGLWG